MTTARSFSWETVLLSGLGAAFLTVGALMCVSAYRSLTSAVRPPSAVVAIPPALPPAQLGMPEESVATAPFAPATRPKSIFGPPPVLDLAPEPQYAAAPAPYAPERPTSPSIALGAAAPLPPLRPIELNGPRPTFTTPGSPDQRPSLLAVLPAPSSLTAYDRYTAVYDLSAHVVYLPGGGQLEAHSGLGPLRDDPSHVDERDRGATPPHLYDLTLREDLFHGVQALRLNPVGGPSAIFGRAGLLAHTYMLGPGGDSNGCVSFRNYDAFLRAFESGQVKRLAVVTALK